MKLILTYILFVLSPFLPILLGTLLGVVSSFLGIGGGIFLVPMLPLIYELSAYEAIILSLSFIFFTVSINTIIFQFQKKIVWKLVGKMGLMILVGSFVGSSVASHVPDIYLRSFLILFLLIMSYNFFLTLKNRATENKSNEKSLIKQLPPQGLGLFAGLLSGFAGVGSGVFLNYIVLKDPNVRSDQESPTVNAMMIFVCSGVFASALWTKPFIFTNFYQTIGIINICLVIVGILLGAFMGKALNAKNFHRARVILLFLLTFALAIIVLYEMIFK